MRIQTRHYASGDAILIEHDGNAIRSLLPAENDSNLPWVSPALFDLQINGALGISFNSPALQVTQIRDVVDHCRTHGIAGLLPTVITGSSDAIAHGLSTLARACESDPVVATAVPGIHLEGPYIAAEDGPRGAHPKEHVRDPDLDEFHRWQESAQGKIRLITLTEQPGALAFIEAVACEGVVVAIGHTAATASQIRDAVHAGARLSTHLGNGAHALIHRHENPLWAQLATDELWASFIPDGHHLPAALVKTIVRMKPNRAIITSDASSLAGLPPGSYREWGSEFEVRESGKIVVPGTPYLAGSALFTDSCIGMAMTQGELTLSAAINMASARPRELLSLPVWEIAVGSTAPLMLFNRDAAGIRVREVIGGYLPVKS